MLNSIIYSLIVLKILNGNQLSISGDFDFSHNQVDKCQLETLILTTPIYKNIFYIKTGYFLDDDFGTKVFEDTEENWKLQVSSTAIEKLNIILNLEKIKEANQDKNKIYLNRVIILEKNKVTNFTEFNIALNDVLNVDLSFNVNYLMRNKFNLKKETYISNGLVFNWSSL